MKLRGRIGTHEVVVIIDCGATHNFISVDLVRKLDIPLITTGGYNVVSGTGLSVRGIGICKGVVLSLPEAEIVEDFVPIELGSSDVILGMQWLGSLGGMHVNWKTLTTKFKVGNTAVTLQVDPGLCKYHISLKAMMRAIQCGGQGMLIELGSLSMDNETEGSPVPYSIQAILLQFESVFHMPEGLPPNREKEHATVLQEGTSPINVRPYRYPQAQKDKIERLVREMLAAGIIQPSCSPFFSPVLLVKKKDGSWRFYVDHRALNKATVPDRFPIPIIDELLDELHGAVVFSKLDLKSGYHQTRVCREDMPKIAFHTHTTNF